MFWFSKYRIIIYCSSYLDFQFFSEFHECCHWALSLLELFHSVFHSFRFWCFLHQNISLISVTIFSFYLSLISGQCKVFRQINRKLGSTSGLHILYWNPNSSYFIMTLHILYCADQFCILGRGLCMGIYARDSPARR